MSAEVKHLVSNGVAWGIDELMKFYREGNIRGFQFQLVQSDGQFVTGRCGDISYLEKLGLLEAAKADVIFKVWEEDNAL